MSGKCSRLSFLPAGLAYCLLSGCVQQTALRAPSSFVAFTAPEGAFQGLRPEDWREVTGVSPGKMSGVSFNKYDARVGITADLKPLEGTLEQVHQRHQSRAAHGVTHYQEGRARPLTSRLGKGYLSEFTGALAAPLGSNAVHGYRATLSADGRELTVVARCWETDWKTLEPAFLKVIQSLRAPSLQSDRD